MDNVSQAYIFDLDGVLTKTEILHGKAWKDMFDEFLLQREKANHQQDEILRPFDVVSDYVQYLDGKPRSEGVASFLHSRNIELGASQIQELGLIKNSYYQKFLEKEGPQLVPESFSFIQKLKEKNIPMAVVSSSRSCRKILLLAGIKDYFDVIVDPQVAEVKKLQGKPDPDYFLEASRMLGLLPGQCSVIEDSLAGIEAGKKGSFKKVIGVNLDGDAKALNLLKEKGADEVISSLWDIHEAQVYLDLPNALSSFDQIISERIKKKYFLFLDFDGTLSPIVSDPKEARPLEGIEKLIGQLSRKHRVCIITGRDLGVIRGLIDIPGFYYAACHGFEISGPNNFHFELDEANDLIPNFDRAEKELHDRLKHIEGIIFERKKFGLGLHYRSVKSEDDIIFIKKTVKNLTDNSPLRFQLGEKVVEVQPRLEWDKGKALLKIYDALKINRSDYPPVYLGDGNTDEDAFREMRAWGISILASVEARPSLAHFHLKGPSEVKLFLERLVGHV